jgi:hypothetical protein
MTGTPQGTGVYNVTYTGNSMTTSTELNGSDLDNVTVNLTAGQTLTMGANAGPDGNLSVSSGTLDLLGFTIDRSASGGIFTLADGATLLVGGANNFPTAYSTVNLGAASTVNYDYPGAQTVSAQTYGNLIFSDSGEKSMVAGTTVAGNLSISGASANVAADQNLSVASLTLDGLGKVNGTWGSSSSSAAHQDDTYFAGTGILTVSADTRSTPTILWPTASAIIYGQTLAFSTLSGGSSSVSGAFAFTAPSTMPDANPSYSASVTFTPSDLST